MKHYMVYDKWDNLLIVGDVFEISNYLGIEQNSVYKLVIKTSKGNTLKHKVYRCEDDDVEFIKRG